MSDKINTLKKCSNCIGRFDELSFTRKGKIFNSCNGCSERLRLKHKEKASLSPDEIITQKKYNKEYYLLRKDELDKKSKEYNNNLGIIVCECGCVISGPSIKYHRQTQKHMRKMAEK